MTLIKGRLSLARGTGGGGGGGNPWVYVDIGCGFIYLPVVVWGQVVVVWATAEPDVTGVDHYIYEITPDLWAIDITGDGDLSIHSSDSGRMMAQVYKPGDAVFTTCG